MAYRLWSFMKKIIKNILIVASAYTVGCGIGIVVVKTINHYARQTAHYQQNRIVWLSGNRIGCTGTEVVAPSGKVLTLTAAHCQKQIIDNKIGFKDQSGAEGMVAVISIDDRLDLMLLEGAPKKLGFEIAKDVKVDDTIHTMTHGWTMPAYRTEGMVMSTTMRPDEPKCEQYVDLGGYKMGVGCQPPPERIVTTAWVLPGSSGGPLLNENNDLVGIVYALTGPFSYSVSLKDIQAFLKGR